MFWRKKKSNPTNPVILSEAQRAKSKDPEGLHSPIQSRTFPTSNLPTGPAIRQPLTPKSTPGYYPNFHTLDQQNYWDAATRTVILKRITDIKPIRFFSPTEALTMQAVVSRIMPQEDRTETHRIPIFAPIDERLHESRIEGFRYEDMPSDQDAYRLGAKAFEAMAQDLYKKSFHQLSTLEQERILQSIHDAKPIAAKKIWQQMNIKHFWAMLVSDCCAAYYSHPWAWDEIGFGGPAYPRGYMRLEDGEAEPWEVNEQRYKWDAPADTISDLEQKEPQGMASHYGQAGTH